MISSEENMIGEALMRVSNTLEAQRLTKSLDYQEKLRRRSNTKFTISIILLIVLFFLLVLTGVATLLIWKFAGPVQEKLLPFMSEMFSGMGRLFNNLVDSSDYLPVLVRQMTEMLDQLIITMKGMNSLNLGGMLSQLGQMLGTLNVLLLTVVDMMQGMNCMMKGIPKMLGGVGEMLAPVIDSAGGMMAGMTEIMGKGGNIINAMLDGIDPAVITGMVSNIGNMMSGAVEGMNDLFGKLKDFDMSGLLNAGGTLMNTMMQAMQKFAEAMNKILKFFG